MNRRQALQVMVATPIVLSSSVSQAVNTGVTFYRCGEHEQMVRQLWENVEAYYVLQRSSLDAESMTWPQVFQVELMKDVCAGFCKKLLDPRGSPLEQLFPEEDPALIRARVAFGVMSGPTAIINGRVHKAMVRRLRAQSCMTEGDLQGNCRGMPVRLETIEAIADECTFESTREIRNDWRGGMQTNAYVLSLPPFIPPVILSPEWSYRRSWMIRYAKSCAKDFS